MRTCTGWPAKNVLDILVRWLRSLGQGHMMIAWADQREDMLGHAAKMSTFAPEADLHTVSRADSPKTH